MLAMGVYATRPDGTIVIPTVWAEVGIVREGTQPSGVDPAEPTPSWAAQVQQWASDAAESAETATETAAGIRADMDEFNESSATVLADARTATTAANGAAANANTAASAANTSATAADAATASAVTATGAANDAASAANAAAALATSAAGVATDAAGNADIATAAARAATADAQTATTNANAAASAASSATTDATDATAAARQATTDATTAATNANAATESAITAASAANAAAVTASQEAEGANAAAELANAATTAATNATQAATTAAAAANQATATANDAAERAEDAIEAIGDISELAVPLMSADVRGGAKLGEGLDVVDGALTISTEANESTGDVRGSIARLTAKGWAEQTVTDDPPSPSPDYPAEIRVARGHTIDGKSGRYVDIEVQGKNLLSDVAADWVSSSVSGTNRKTTFIPVEPGEVLHYQRNSSGGQLGLICGWVDENKENYVAVVSLTNYVKYTFTNSGNYAYLLITHNGTLDYATVFKTREAIIERGDAFTGYEPYFHHTIPVPLPSKGYAASLPDGTADTLALDGAGKWEWENAVETKVVTEFSAYGGIGNNRASRFGVTLETSAKNALGYCTHLSDWIVSTTSSYNYPVANRVFRNYTIPTSIVVTLDTSINSLELGNAWLAEHGPMTLMYQLLEHTTESGYTEAPMPSIPSEAVVTCPELDDLGVSYLIGDDVRAMAEQWYARAKSEYDGRITALEQAVAELVTS